MIADSSGHDARGMNGTVKRAATYLVSGFVSQGATFCLWLALPWFLSPAEVGYVSLALFAVELFTAFCMAGMDAALIRFAAQPEAQGAALTAAMTICGTIFVIVAGLSYAALHASLPVFADTVAWVSAHFGLVLVAVAANVVWNLYQSYQVAAKQAREYGVFQVVRAVAYLAFAFGAFALFAQEAATLVGVMAFSSLAVLALFVRRARLPSLAGNPFRGERTVQMVRYGLPLMVYSLLGVAVVYTQRLVVDHYTDVSVLGVFGFFTVIAIQLNGLWGSLNKSWTPEFFSRADADKAESIRTLQGLLAMMSAAYPAALAVYVVLGEAFFNRLVFPPAYAAQTDVFYLLLLAMSFTGLYTVAYPLFYYDLRTRRILAISVFLAAANLGLSVALTSAWGAVGAAVSVVLMAAVTMWIYLLAYPDWMRGGRRAAFLLAVVTLLVGGAAALLLAGHSPWLFAGALFSTSVVAWAIGGALARPLLRSVHKRMHRC
jgi:O-antigen/teichoic acid export membrane protein